MTKRRYFMPTFSSDMLDTSDRSISNWSSMSETTTRTFRKECLSSLLRHCNHLDSPLCFPICAMPLDFKTLCSLSGPTYAPDLDKLRYVFSNICFFFSSCWSVVIKWVTKSTPKCLILWLWIYVWINVHYLVRMASF